MNSSIQRTYSVNFLKMNLRQSSWNNLVMEKFSFVNRWVDNNYDKKIEEQLEFKHCIDQYLDSPAVHEVMRCFEKSFKESVSNLTSDTEQINKCFKIFANLQMEKLVPPGTKGVIKGNKFRDIVYDEIRRLLEVRHDFAEFKIMKEPPTYEGDTKPDISIQKGKIVLPIFVQLDFHRGGAQQNRGKSYVLNKVCVICGKPPKFRRETVVYNIYKNGIKNHTLYYVSNLSNCLAQYFP